ncbi:MAG: hypothetical protein IPM64_10350 [Phycisphaerales bacterium]|nr:hypothetical protein [Phycisphaerales bacterium]
MSLTDVMSHSGFAMLQTAASLVFVAAFAAIVLRALLRSREEVQHCAALPLADEPAPPGDAQRKEQQP